MLLGLPAASLALGADPALAAGLPPLTLSTTTATPGDTVSIQGAHWPGHSVLQAAVCGGGENSVSSDCDLLRAISFGSTDDGVVQAALVVSVPPTPCPCVVMITRVNPSAVERLALKVEGARTAPVPVNPALSHPAVQISDVHVVSDNSWTSWFGTAAARELVLTVKNRSPETIRPLVVAAWVQGKDAFVISSLPAHRLAAGRSVQVEVPFSLSTFVDGSFPVVGKVTGTGFEESFSSSTSTKPVALYALAILLACALLLVVAAAIGRPRREGPKGNGSLEPVDAVIAKLLDEDPTAQLSQIGAMV